jgi:hypothetical protein
MRDLVRDHAGYAGPPPSHHFRLGSIITKSLRGAYVGDELTSVMAPRPRVPDRDKKRNGVVRNAASQAARKVAGSDRSEAMSFSAYMGALHENLADVAWRIHHLAAEVPIVVWADESGQVLAAPANGAPVIRPIDFVGNYDRCGRSVESKTAFARRFVDERESPQVCGR